MLLLWRYQGLISAGAMTGSVGQHTAAAPARHIMPYRITVCWCPHLQGFVVLPQLLQLAMQLPQCLTQRSGAAHSLLQT